MRMKVIGVIEKGQDGTYDIRMSHHKLDFFLLGQGDTVELAKEDFLVSDEEMRDLYKEEKNAYPNLEFVYKFDLPSFLEFYSKKIGYSSLEKITGVNQRQLSQYVQGYRNPSKSTTLKIEKGLKDFAEELSQIKYV